ncbi:MAG TPA: NAD(P)/FAD-dependent oxidoreductase [Bdellovibrionota bacterium]|nr:NAD(P)/FAD-dependent oxidoreductase [Bdellovibrionota bacterium]
MEQKSGAKKVLIVGGGFAGLNAAKALGKREDLVVTIIDQRNHHLFQPLLYQVASAGLSPADIASPIRSIFSRKDHVNVVLDRVQGVRLAERAVELADGKTLSYDYLVLACGATHSYFGHEEWEEHAPGLKTLEQATEIRRRILLAFEEAEKESLPTRKKMLQTFVVVGGGPTGVELAGAIGEMSRYTLKRDFRSIDPSRTRIFLIEAGPRILPSFSARLSRRATQDLERLGVSVWTDSPVTRIEARGVQVGEDFLEAGCVLWAAGVKPSPLNATLGVPLDRQGRVMVREDLSLASHPEVFVLGDQAHSLDAKSQKPLPGLAPVAIQQGRHVARVIVADLHGKARRSFKYIDKGQMATIGRKKAVAESAGLEFTGFTAWMMWLFVHVYYLIGFKNRLFVMLQWMWSYLTFSRGARLIVSKDWRTFKNP